MSVLNIKAELDMSKVEQQEAEWKGRLRVLNGQVQRAQRDMGRVAIQWTRMLSVTLRSARAVLRSIGMAIHPAFDAMIGTVVQTVATLHAIAAAYTAGGVTAWAGAGVELAALTLTASAMTQVMLGREDAMAKVSNAEMALQGIGATLTEWGTITRRWGG